MRMDIRRMLVLVEVSRTGSLTAAAESLSYTVSAVSQQIGQLEDEAGQPLIERRPRGVTLTEAGRAVVRHAEKIERIVSAAHEELRDLAGLNTGTLRLGTVPTVTESFLPAAISAFRAHHPGVDLRIHSAQLSGLEHLLESREIELAITWDRERPADGPGKSLTSELIFRDPSVLLVPSSHRLAARSSVRMEELRHEPWIIRTSPNVLALLNAACEAAGFEPIVTFEARSYQEAQAMVAVGMGIALVPRLSLYSLRDDIRVLTAVSPRPPSRRIVLAHRRGERLSPAGSAMRKLLIETGRAWAPA
ncbi:MULTISPECIES: LysR family transcriptional regulator [Amycolatopsis]|uniref:LysR family transcriptional regulator n=1 Tax=Amycolatopsis dendrobii TaxID=2760662 RepID=A0A7W3Z902_9PSEU|nr:MULTISPECIES: LysR family transcriptional regulator [Amycolatopsis]MBB1152219.1 LysR family transcriptional regulator [Amycolatopsis dendrobii]UKD57507.1 LysR family transcriptional regulator [Amycolatopsis sp. FU40]